MGIFLINKSHTFIKFQVVYMKRGVITIFLLYFNALSYDEKITFEKLFKRYKNYMFAIALSYHKNKFDAEDVVQDACIRLMKNLSKIKDIESTHTKGFISVITRNVAIDKYNINKNEIATDEDWQFDFEASFDESIHNKEALIHHIKKLNPIYIHVLILSFIYDLSTKEMADLLDISEQAVRKRKSRALKELKKRLDKEGEFYE